MVLPFGAGWPVRAPTVISTGERSQRVGEAIATIRQRHPQAKLEACAGDLSTADVVQRVVRRFAHVDI